MKNPDQNPHPNPLRSSSAEEPIIRPLDARRVPSATGAAFTLPVLPDGGEEVPVEAIPEAVEPPIDETFEPIMIIDPVVEEGSEEPLPVTFDEIVDLAVCDVAGEFDVTLEAPVEEFNPDVIFYTLFTGGPETGGEMPPGEDGEFVIVDGTFTGEEPEIAVCDGLIVKEDAVFEEGEGEVTGEEGGSSEIVEEPTFVDADGDLIDDVTGEPIKVPIEWVIRQNVTTSEGETVENPEIFYSTGGVDVNEPTTTADVDKSGAEAAPTPAPAAHDHPAPVAETPAPAPVASSVDLTIELQGGAPTIAFNPAQSIALDTAAPSFGDLEHAASADHAQHAGQDVASFELGHLPAELTATTISGAELSSAANSTAPDAAVDQWVPQTVEHDDAILPIDGLVHEVGADVTLPAADQASVLGLGSLKGSSLAMALTGAALVARDGTKRDEKEQA